MHSVFEPLFDALPCVAAVVNPIPTSHVDMGLTTVSVDGVHTADTY